MFATRTKMKMTKNTLRKWTRKLTRGYLKIDRHCAQWLLTLQKPGRTRGTTEVLTAKGKSLDSAGRKLFAQIEGL
jgi:hypothetical protein